MKIHKHIFIILLFCLLGIIPLKAQTYRPRLNRNNEVVFRASKVYFGIQGNLTCTALYYPELHDEKMKVLLSGDAGLFLEWRFFDKVSVEFEAIYARRKAGLTFDTPYLTSYTETAVTHISYLMSVTGIEGHLPVTWYFGKPKPWFDSYSRFFMFAGPAFFLGLDGSLEWERRHLIDDQIIASYNMPLSDHSISPYEYGAIAGFGIIYKQKVRRYYFVTKAALSFYYGLSDTFSKAEKSLSTQFYGLGDIQHETLGTRYFRQIKLSLSFAVPFRDKPAEACRGLDIH